MGSGKGLPLPGLRMVLILTWLMFTLSLDVLPCRLSCPVRGVPGGSFGMVVRCAGWFGVVPRVVRGAGRASFLIGWA